MYIHFMVKNIEVPYISEVLPREIKKYKLGIYLRQHKTIPWKAVQYCHGPYWSFHVHDPHTFESWCDSPFQRMIFSQTLCSGASRDCVVRSAIASISRSRNFFTKLGFSWIGPIK